MINYIILAAELIILFLWIREARKIRRSFNL